ncbi:hypothetical protein EJB05_23379, partial [Eragrostis curvula]
SGPCLRFVLLYSPLGRVLELVGSAFLLHLLGEVGAAPRAWRRRRRRRRGSLGRRRRRRALVQGTCKQIVRPWPPEKKQRLPNRHHLVVHLSLLGWL